MQSSNAGIADIHARTLSDSFQAFQDRNLSSAVLGPFCRLLFSFLGVQSAACWCGKGGYLSIFSRVFWYRKVSFFCHDSGGCFGSHFYLKISMKFFFLPSRNDSFLESFWGYKGFGEVQWLLT